MRLPIVLGVALAACWPAVAVACPFCPSLGPTWADDIAGAEFSVLARLVRSEKNPPQLPAERPLGLLPDEPQGEFLIQEILKGSDPAIAAGGTVKTGFSGSEPVGSIFLLNGYRSPEVYWSTPLPLPGVASEYVRQANRLPAEGPERLAFFLKYLQHPEEPVDRDAYGEFAKAPFDSVKAIRSQFDRQKLWQWIDDPKITALRKRLYYVMLSLCGDDTDRDRLEQMLLNRSQAIPTEALDSIVACYLSLAKEPGLPLVEREFFSNPETTRDDAYAAVTAIRFHGQDENIIPRDKLTPIFRRLLDRPALAELVIPDLARWEDWTLIEPLVQLFKSADQDTYFIRVPVVQYLAVCPLPQARQTLEELRAIDPQAVSRGVFFAQRETDSPEVAPPAAAPARLSLADPPTRVVAEDKAKPNGHPLPEAPSDATLTWSLVAASVAFLALITAFFAFHRRGGNGKAT